MNEDKLILEDMEFNSRLIVGTGKYGDFETMRNAIEASGAEIVTIAIRRINLDDKSNKSLLEYIDRERYTLLPNTAGCYTAKEAVLTAELAREALGSNMVKLEVIGDQRTLFPDNAELLDAAKELIKKEFIVLPLITSAVPVFAAIFTGNSFNILAVPDMTVSLIADCISLIVVSEKGNRPDTMGLKLVELLS